MALIPRKKRWLLVSLAGIAVLACLATAVTVVVHRQQNKPSDSAAETPVAGSAATSETPNAATLPTAPTSPVAAPPTSPPTDDGTRGDDGPRDSSVPTPSQQGDDGRRIATVTLTAWGVSDDQLSASGFVPGVVESSGTCTLIASDGSSTVSATGPGNPAASTTACAEGLSIPRNNLHPGTWQVSIAYSSLGFSGTSGSQTIEVE